MTKQVPLGPSFDFVQLSPHFTLAELCYSETARRAGILNKPSDVEVDHLRLLCTETLEPIRAICGEHQVFISSGFRGDTLNQIVGGARDSAHRLGLAADITIPDFGDTMKIVRTLAPQIEALKIDQLIYEANSHGHRWVHVGRSVGTPRHQMFSIFNGQVSNRPFPG
jgi:zinc D-Ala-D-Ala carboxypeptidase